MTKTKFTVFGNRVSELRYGSHTFNDVIISNVYEETIDLKTEDLGNKIWELWSLRGNKIDGSLITIDHENVQFGVYCLDLSKEINYQKIEKDISDFRKSNPKAPLILIGALRYLVNEEAALHKLANLGIEDINEYCVAVNGEVPSPLFNNLIATLQNQRHQLSLWQEAKKKFENAIKDLPITMQAELLETLDLFEKEFAKNEDKAYTIEAFLTTIYDNLDNKHQVILKAANDTVKAAIITLLLSTAGFSIGLALCIVVPEAFIIGAGMMVGNVTLASLKTVKTGLSCYSLFNEATAIAAAEEKILADTVNDTPPNP